MNARADDVAARAQIAWLPLIAAMVIMFGVCLWPRLLVGADGHADHVAAMLVFWAMSAGFVRGVGFIPEQRLWRYLLSATVCWICILLTAVRLVWS